MVKQYCIAKEYTKNPGARYIKQGLNSGEDFRKKVLEPFFETKQDNDILQIDLNDLNGYPSLFFEEAFGGIARIFKQEDVLKSLRFICDDNPLFIDDLISYIRQEKAK
jgi:hypothetical protein